LEKEREVREDKKWNDNDQEAYVPISLLSNRRRMWLLAAAIIGVDLLVLPMGPQDSSWFSALMHEGCGFCSL
jgi:hypothetical protein